MKSSQAILDSYISNFLDVKDTRKTKWGAHKLSRYGAFVMGLRIHFPELQHEAMSETISRDLAQIKVVLQRYVAFLSNESDALLILKQIRSPEWRDLVQAALYRYLVAASTATDSNAAASELLILAQKKLRTVQLWEGLVTLALAVWKAQCLLQMPKDSDYSMSSEWKTSGWKVSKMDQLESNAIFIVVNSVKPFLCSKPSDHVEVTSNVSYASICLQSPPGALETFLTSWLKFAEDPDLYRKTRSGDYTCLVCEKIVQGPRRGMHSHSMESDHWAKLQTYASDLICIKNVILTCAKLYTKPLLDLVDQAAHFPSRDKVHAELYRSLFDPLTRTHEDKSMVYPLNMKELLMTLHGQVYCLAILGLACWKAQCLGQMPIGSDYLAAEQWKSVGWKACKSEHKDFSKTQAIVAATRPFLGPPYQEDSSWHHWMSKIFVYVVGYIVYVWIRLQEED
jgi:hypothetical protein